MKYLKFHTLAHILKHFNIQTLQCLRCQLLAVFQHPVLNHSFIIYTNVSVLQDWDTHPPKKKKEKPI